MRRPPGDSDAPVPEAEEQNREQETAQAVVASAATIFTAEYCIDCRAEGRRDQDSRPESP